MDWVEASTEDVALGIALEAGAAATVKVAEPLQTLPDVLDTSQRNIAPLSAAAVWGTFTVADVPPCT